ncbi:MAG: DNA primase, partial [Carnobacterium sp.]
AFIDFVKESSLKSKLVEIELLSVSEEMTAREIEDYIDVISRKSILQSQLKEKQEAMTEASRRGDQAQLRTLMIEVVNLSRSLKNS